MSRFSWTAPDGSRHQAGREPDTHVHLQGDGADGSQDCDEDSDCRDRPGGVCYSTSVPAGYMNHVCTYDECSEQQGCGSEAICVPPGIWHATARCIRAICRNNSDCTERAEGRCRYLSGMFGCVYGDDPCDVDRPCPRREQAAGSSRRQRCALTDDGARCEIAPSPPP